jgi:hypothetical protein
MFKRIKERFLNWYRGPWEEPDNRGSNLVFLGHHNPHWTARGLQAAVGFWAKHWKWIIGTSLAVAGLWLTYHKS